MSTQAIRFFHRIGAPLTEQVFTFGDILRLYVQMVRLLLRWPLSEKKRLPEIGLHIVQMGIGSLPIIVISTAFAGLVVTQEIAWHMDEALHTIQMIPGFTGQFILRELGVAVPALLVVAKVGAATTAEVGTMKVTEQIDALKLLRIDPIEYLVFPRFVASIVSLTCLTLISIAITLGCAIGVAVTQYHFNLLEFINSVRHFISLADLFGAVIKGMLFGSVIPVIACGYAFRCKGGAQGVGTATTEAVVSSTIVVIVLDFILTYAFSALLY